MSDLEKITASFRAMAEENKRLAVENTELRTRRFVRFNQEECWIYDMAGDNYLESLVCPVVISAIELSRILRISQLVETLPVELIAAQGDPNETGYMWDVNDCARWLREQINK